MKFRVLTFALVACSAYAEGGYTRAEQALADLKAGGRATASVTSMDIVRRAHEELPKDEQRLFVEGIKREHQASPDDTGGLFLQGYAQVVFRGNRSGLRLLRVTDERLRSPVSALAYGFALAEIGRARPEDPDGELYVKAMWNLQDAWRRNAAQPSPGFLRSYEEGMERLGISPGASRIPGSSPSR